MHKIIHVLEHSFIDSVKLIPFLFIAFLIIEWVEHKLSKKSKNIISKSGKYGPIIGSSLGLIPQCGFSVIATNLYITRIISIGTLIAIYLSTSDEMLPILLSKQCPAKTIILFLVCKFLIGMFFGFIIDFILRKNKKEKIKYDICEDEHCGCAHEKNLIKSSLIHTIKIFLFILLSTIIIGFCLEYLGEDLLSKLFLKDSIFAPFITSLIGFIPNCGASVIITELYLSGAISFAATLSGLLTNSGIAILILFKSNKNLKENFTILGLTYGIGVLVGIVTEIVMYII